MGMDKEVLFSFFHDHYFSRQEVLFRLPLNYSIDAFWQELLNRRKSRALLLPLYNAVGMPYWYVLTQKMVAASEKLCEEALLLDESFDPYRVEMTSAMTEEMFFTSFVEGAQFPLHEAMDFLSRGTEPESIHEQMIWNNRRAWVDMISGIYRPLDEVFVKALAFMLTEEMEGCAEDYRQTDDHPIAAMRDEPYNVLPAYIIPERMSQYYAFLGSQDTHPLIKAAVAQAYVLVARPFPEGNERLSRMLSSAVLLRSGYDFFRDISLSSVIARESYQYYKAMCDIIRPENGGDMTYFMEYYLEMLVRALDDRKERLRRRQQDVLDNERRMASVPLIREDAVPVYQTSGSAGQKTASDKEIPAKYQDEEFTVGKHIPMKEFLAAVEKLKHSSRSRTSVTIKTVREMITSGRLTFTVQQWAEATGQSRNNADYQCRHLFRKGLLDRDKRGQIMSYTFRVIPMGKEKNKRSSEKADGSELSVDGSSDGSTLPANSQAIQEAFARMQNSNSDALRCAADTIRRMVQESKLIFQRRDWPKLTGLPSQKAEDTCDWMLRKGVVSNVTPGKHIAVYRINETALAADGQHESQQANKLTEYSNGTSVKDLRIHCFLAEKKESGQTQFSSDEWKNRFDLGESSYNNDLRTAVAHGLITRIGITRDHFAIYRINQSTTDHSKANGMTHRQKEMLSIIHAALGKRQFTLNECAALLGQAETAMLYYLKLYVDRGILSFDRRSAGAGIYALQVTPETHPDCFADLSSSMESWNSDAPEAVQAAAV